MGKKVLVFLLVIFLVNGAAALSSLTASPGDRDLGTLERGSSKEVSFYLSSDASETFEVRASYRDPLYSRVFEEGSGMANEFSREDIQPWIEFERDTFPVDPNGSEAVNLDSGAAVIPQGTVNFTVTVPTDAEPGYHVGGLGLSPTDLESGDFVGARNIVISRPTFSFRVPGEVRRNVEIVDLRARRVGDESAQIIAEFQNTGTVTTKISSQTLSIVNEAGQKAGEVTVGGQTVAPGNYIQSEATWSDENVQAGEYYLEGEVNFMTGNSYVGENQASFVLTQAIQDRVEIQEEQTSEPSDQQGPSMFLVIIFLVLLGVVLYSFDIDPFLVVITICALGVTALILMTAIPNWFIILLLMGLGGMIYYV